MECKQELETRLEFKQEALKEARVAYLSLLRGGVKAYGIGGRNLTKLDIPVLEETIGRLEMEIDSLKSRLSGGGSRKAVGVVPWDF